jgi:hypothetical protein
MAPKKAATPRIRRRADGTIAPGAALNPRGRPKGVKELVPRGFVKKLVLGVISSNVEQVAEALRRAAVSPRSVISVLEHAARLNREIGGGAEGAGGATTIVMRTNVDFSRLLAAAPRAASVEPATTDLAKRRRE